MRKLLSVIFVVLFWANLSWADKIYLSTGKVVEGKIIKEDNISVRIQVGKLPYTYYRAEINKVEKDQPPDAVATPEQKLAEPVSEKKKELIRRLFAVNQTRENMSKMFQAIIEQAPKESQEQIKGLLKVDEVLERLIPVFSIYYTEEDLTDLITFYSSPTGQKYLKVMPQVIEDTMKEAVKYFQEKVAEQ